MTELGILLLLAFLLDLAFGDPRYGLHPVRVMGRLVSGFETLLRRAGLDGVAGGAILVVGVEIASIGLYLAPSLVLCGLNRTSGLIFDLFAAYSCLALKDLFAHLDGVLRTLDRDDLPGARRAIAKVVGRDAGSLDERGISRAAIETVSENFVDGFLSPLFCYLAGGLAGSAAGLSPVRCGLCLMVAFKAASTLDSMVGYKDSRYLRFGRAGARLDDLMNFIPARLSLPVLMAGAWMAGLNGMAGMRVALRDRLRHESPNAAHAESFVAGALGVRLGGGGVYGGTWKEKAWLGEGNPDPGPDEVRASERLVRRAAWAAVMPPAVALILLG